MKKKILSLGFLLLSLLFLVACSNSSSKQVGKELEGEYYWYSKVYEELSEKPEIIINNDILIEYDGSSKYSYSIDTQKKTLTGDGKVYSYTYEDGKLVTDISGNMTEYYQKGSKAYKEFIK